MGRAWYKAGKWLDAAGHFTKSAELRETDRAYDWLYAAMSHHQRGEVEKAKLDYERATTEMENSGAVDPELESLRIAAVRLLVDDDGDPDVDSP
jgi:uncharacterized protein HemY